MRHLLRYLAVAVALLPTVGCNSTNEPVSSGPTPGPVPAGVSQPPDKAKGYVRVINVAIGLNSAALAVEGKQITEAVGYGSQSGFTAVEPGKLKIFAVDGEGKNIAGPMPMTLDGGEDATVAITGTAADAALLPFKHKNHGAETGKVKVAFIHADKSLPTINVGFDGKKFRGDVGYGEDTEYTMLSPGEHWLQADYTKKLPSTAAPTPELLPGATPPAPVKVTPVQTLRLSKQQKLETGKVYSVVVFQKEDKLPQMVVMEDRFVPTFVRSPDADVTPSPTGK